MSRRGRKRKAEDEEQKIVEGEQDNLSSDETRQEIETMWEIPQIFQFLHLTRESLNVPQFSIYEMERMLLIPRASKQLANIMTCLLSSPITKAKLRKVPPMPYEFWTNILAHKMGNWFKVYHAKHKDAAKILEIVGIEPEFWNVFPDAALLDGKDFENLTFKQRVWLLKTVCDTIMHTRKTVQEDIAKQPWEDQFEKVLGADRYGARYIYFPQFIPNDLRIYRHSLDNKILSTVKPVRTRQETETGKIIGERLNRYRQRKLHSHGSVSERKSSRRESKMNEKDDRDVNGCKSNNNDTGSFISEDTTLSNSSTCSSSNNNNNNNNNSISLDAIRKTRRTSNRLASKMPEGNASSPSAIRTGEYISDRSVDGESSQMFKGFDNTKEDSYSIGIINEMLDNLKSEIDKDEKVESGCKSNDGSESANQQGADPLAGTDFRGSENVPNVGRDESERSSDNSSSCSKTDDEKLNEIIGAEHSKCDDNASDNSSTSKSDDEKLNETQTSSTISASENEVAERATLNGTFRASSDDSASLSEEVVERERSDEPEISLRATRTRANSSSEGRTSRMRARLRSGYRAVQRIERDRADADAVKDRKIEKRDFPTSDAHLREALNAVSDYVNGDADYEGSKDSKTDECKQHFNRILSDLGVSDFHLVADSVEGLRELIASFSANDSESNNTIKTEAIPPCELKLVTKLTELLSSLEMTETILKDATRKARAKLQREWSNFKEGAGTHSQPTETQRYKRYRNLPYPHLAPKAAPSSDKTRSRTRAGTRARSATAPGKAVRPIGNVRTKENGEKTETARDSRTSRRARRRKETETRKKDSGRSKGNARGTRTRRTTKNNITIADMSADAEQRPQRVLRARGVSSYTEQFYSDDESDENELEGWTDIEAVYAAPSAQTGASAAHAAPKIGHADDWSEQEEEDSDQDWILPSSRKRKNKRSLANRRLKSLQQRVQTIAENTNESSAAPDAHKMKPKNNSEGGDASKEAPAATSSKKRQAFSDAICKLESIGSVHSELNIEDDIIYESGATPAVHYQQNSYGLTGLTRAQQNYYNTAQRNRRGGRMPRGAPLMRQTDGTVQQAASPQSQQGYYAQPNARASYVMQAANFPSVAQQQQQQQQQPPVFAQKEPQLIGTTQPYVNNANYMPRAPVAQHQAQYVGAPGAMPQNPVLRAARPHRYSRNNERPVRGQVPGRGGSSQGPTNPASVRGGGGGGHAPRQRVPNSNSVTRQRTPQAERARRTPRTESSGQKTTSLIMLSDSDDEIEMIITEKTNASTEGSPPQSKQRPMVTSDIAIGSTKGISPQIIQRMSQSGISITPIKITPPPSASNSSTQLVVVVNETGSHYALALPNGSKLILTPEQVAQIRASNGGKLIL